MKKALWFLLGYSILGAVPVLAECPSMDFTGDCFVDLADFAVFMEQWLTGDRFPISVEMLPIPAGAFSMGDSFVEGDSAERPVHTVTLDSFAMGKYEITNGQYRDFLNSAREQGLVTVTKGVVYKSGSATSYPYCDTSTSDPYSWIVYSDNTFSVRTKGGKDMTNHPMVCVSWYGAVGYCNWLSQREGRQICYNLSTWDCDFSKQGYRLATEAEWEYAARGGQTGSRFPWGDTMTHSQANYNSSSSFSYDTSPTRGYHPTWNDGVMPYISPVGRFPANAYGLCDMTGNVWEWCHDWQLGHYYMISPNTNPTGPTTGAFRVHRGGDWYHDADQCRVSYRSAYLPGERALFGGFRIVLDLH